MKNCVIGIIFNCDKSEVLLTKRRDVPVWVLPGGGIEKGEETESAIVREIFEETGLTVAIGRKSGVYFPLNRLASLTHVYECHVVSGKPRLSAETRDINFFPLPHLPDTFFPVHHDWLSDALSNPENLVRKPIFRATYFELFKYFLKHPIHVIRSLLSRIGLPINSSS